MNLLMIGSFPLAMTLVLIIAVWAERLLGERPQEVAVKIEESPLDAPPHPVTAGIRD